MMEEVEFEDDDLQEPVEQKEHAHAVSEYEVVKVIVADPRTAGDALTGYTIYTVSTQIKRAEDRELVDYHVTRRYRDFRWLHSRLKRCFPGFVIPHIPDKTFVGTLSTFVVEKRKRELERFLSRVAEHPVLRRSSFLLDFISLPEEDFQELRKLKSSKSKVSDSLAESSFDHSSSASASSLGSASSASIFSLGFWKGSMSSVTSWVSQSLRHSGSREKTQDDMACDNIAEENKIVLSHWQEAAFSAGKVKDADNTGQVSLMGLGLAFSRLAEDEEKIAAGTGKLACRAQEGSERASVLYLTKVKKDDQMIEEALDDVARNSQAVQELMERRASALKKFLDTSSALDAQKAAVASLREKEKSKDDKIRELEKTILATEELLEDQKNSLDSMTQSTFEEVHRFRLEKSTKLQEICSDYIKNQLEFHHNLFLMWGEIARKAGLDDAHGSGGEV